MQTDAYKESSQNLADAISYGIEDSKNKISNFLSKASEKNNNNEYVYHSTSFQPFIDALMNDRNSAIDKSKTNPECRFGQQFYVASDPMTVRSEAGYVGPLVKFKMLETANILDLTDSFLAESLGAFARNVS